MSLGGGWLRTREDFGRRLGFQGEGSSHWLCVLDVEMVEGRVERQLSSGALLAKGRAKLWLFSGEEKERGEVGVFWQKGERPLVAESVWPAKK